LRLNVDENQQTAGRFNISGIPAMIIFKDGREVDRLVGLQPKNAIAQRLERVMG
jgi:thioredoxin 1